MTRGSKIQYLTGCSRLQLRRHCGGNAAQRGVEEEATGGGEPPTEGARPGGPPARGTQPRGSHTGGVQPDIEWYWRDGHIIYSIYMYSMQGGPWFSFPLTPPPSLLFPLRPLSFLYWRTIMLRCLIASLAMALWTGSCSFLVVIMPKQLSSALLINK